MKVDKTLYDICIVMCRYAFGLLDNFSIAYRKIPHYDTHIVNNYYKFSKFGLSGHKRANSLLTVEARPIKCGIFLFVLTRDFQKRKKILSVPFKKI
jgi:hypothetical protein